MLTLHPRSCCAAEGTCQSAWVLCTVCPEGRHKRQEWLVERCDVSKRRSPDIKLSPVNFVTVFKFAKRSVVVLVICYWVRYTSFVSSVRIISIIFGLFTQRSDFLKKLSQQLRGEHCGVCGHHQRAPVPHNVFVLVKAFGSCSLFAALSISVGPSLSFYPLIYKRTSKCRNPDTCSAIFSCPLSWLCHGV